jgi:hypothetical protein
MQEGHTKHRQQHGNQREGARDHHERSRKATRHPAMQSESVVTRPQSARNLGAVKHVSTGQFGPGQGQLRPNSAMVAHASVPALTVGSTYGESVTESVSHTSWLAGSGVTRSGVASGGSSHVGSARTVCDAWKTRQGVRTGSSTASIGTTGIVNSPIAAAHGPASHPLLQSSIQRTRIDGWFKSNSNSLGRSRVNFDAHGATRAAAAAARVAAQIAASASATASFKAMVVTEAKLEKQLEEKERALRASTLFHTTPDWMHGRVTHTRRSWFADLTPKAGQPIRTLAGGWWDSPKARPQHAGW